MDARDCTSSLWEANEHDPLPRCRSYASHAMEILLAERAEKKAMQANASHQFNIFGTPSTSIEEACAKQPVPGATCDIPSEPFHVRYMRAREASPSAAQKEAQRGASSQQAEWPLWTSKPMMHPTPKIHSTPPARRAPRAS